MSEKEKLKAINLESSFWSRVYLFLKFELYYNLEHTFKKFYHKTKFPKFYRDLFIALTIFPTLLYISISASSNNFFTKWNVLIFATLALIFEILRRYFDGKYKSYYRKKYNLKYYGNNNISEN